MKGCFLLYSISVYSIITAIINVFNYCEMMEICVYVSCILVLWIVLSIQNLPGNAGRDQGDRDGWAEPWASDLPSLHHGCFICMLRSVVSDSVTPMGFNPSGSSVHGDSPGKNTGVGCHALL